MLSVTASTFSPQLVRIHKTLILFADKNKQHISIQSYSVFLKQVAIPFQSVGAAVRNELYSRGIMLAVLEWVHVSVGNGLWEMLYWKGTEKAARRKKRSGFDLSATTHHLVKSRSGPCVVPWYFCLAFKEMARKSDWCTQLAKQDSNWLPFIALTFLKELWLNKANMY